MSEMKAKWVDFKVRILVPAEATIDDARTYIEDAVYSWCGSLRPPGAYGPDDNGDPMRHFQREKTSVKRAARAVRGGRRGRQ